MELRLQGSYCDGRILKERLGFGFRAFPTLALLLNYMLWEFGAAWVVELRRGACDVGFRIWDLRKVRVPYFGVLIISILLSKLGSPIFGKAPI